jgi:hypothetical protein
MGYFSEMYKTAQANLDTAFGKQRDIIAGSADAANREMNANTSIGASRGGYMNSPLFDTLLNRNKANATAGKNQALASLGAAEANANADMAVKKGNAEFQDAQATQQFWGNIISGAGSLAGQAAKMFGGPTGVAAGAGVDVLSNLPTGGTK